MTAPKMKSAVYARVEDHLSSEGVFLMGDAQAMGFPIRYASPGFEQVYGYTAAEIVGKKCGDLIGGPFILSHVDSLAAVATGAGVSLKEAELRVRFLTAKAGEACNVMMACSGSRVGVSLLLNRKKGGSIFVCECLVLNLRHPTLNWSYCVGFQRDITQEVPLRALVTAATSDDAYAELIRSRAASLERRRDVLLGVGSENVVRYLHEKAMDVFSLDIWRTLRNDLIASATGVAHGGAHEAGTPASSHSPPPQPHQAASAGSAASPPPAPMGGTPAAKRPAHASPSPAAACSPPAGGRVQMAAPGACAAAAGWRAPRGTPAPQAQAPARQQQRQLVVSAPPPASAACGAIALPQQHLQQHALQSYGGACAAARGAGGGVLDRRPPPASYHLAVPGAEHSELSWDLLETNSVVEFLNEVGMRKYAEKLLVSGFDDMDTLAEIDNEDLKDLGIPRGHALKLRRSLRAYQCLQICASRKEVEDRHYPAEDHYAMEDAAYYEEAPAAAEGMEMRSAPPAHAEAAEGTRALAVPPGAESLNAVERSWRQVQEFGAERFGVHLFEEVFALDPEACELFPAEVCEKYKDWSTDPAVAEDAPYAPKLHGKVVNLIGGAVIGIHDAQHLVPNLVRLGARHATYGVSPEHLATLGQALVHTLQRCLGDSCTPEVEMAWTVVYNFVAASMVAGLKSTVALPEHQPQQAIAQGGDDPKAALALRRSGPTRTSPTLLQHLHGR